MQELVPIRQATLNAGEVNAVDARELHEALGVKRQFANWIKEQIANAMLVDGVDYVFNIGVKNPKGGRPPVDYLVSLDAAKQICMMSNCEKGRQIRLYFIEVEKRARQFSALPVPQTQAEWNLMLAQQQVAQEKATAALNARVDTLSSQVRDLTDAYRFTIGGYAKVCGVSPSAGERVTLGKKAAQLSRDLRYDIGKMHHPQYGTLNTYHEDILKRVFGREA